MDLLDLYDKVDPDAAAPTTQELSIEGARFELYISAQFERLAWAICELGEA